jgi:4-amino-4-deoxy-L-arabinose transferase-like glycosyltransferase
MLLALLWDYQGLPLQYWDESRNANNALEMAFGTDWLVPTYGGLPDHWNTKPPLLIWFMAGLMKLGVAPLLAVRLPSALAAVATVIVVWAVVRFGLRDRLTALVAAALLLSSKGFTGIHGAHTGDYDALLALFTLGFVVCTWQALQTQHQRELGWVLGAGGCMVLAIMTKGPAGMFGVIGVGLFLLITGQLLTVLRNWRWWLKGILACALVAGYYLIRESRDPGYLQAVWMNELGGRYGETNESHNQPVWFYPRELLKQFLPGSLFLVLLAIPLMAGDPKRKGLSQITFISGAGIVTLLSTAQTKLYWYLIPVIPLLSVAAAIAFVDAIRRVKIPTLYLNGMLALFIVLPVVISIHKNAIGLPAKAQTKHKISQYGVLFTHLRALGEMPTQLTVIDDGIDNTAGFKNYNPELRFYSQLEQLSGVSVRVATRAGIDEFGGLIATCDYKNTEALRGRLTEILVDNPVCVAGYEDPR